MCKGMWEGVCAYGYQIRICRFMCVCVFGCVCVCVYLDMGVNVCGAVSLQLPTPSGKTVPSRFAKYKPRKGNI